METNNSPRIWKIHISHRYTEISFGTSIEFVVKTSTGKLIGVLTISHPMFPTSTMSSEITPQRITELEEEIMERQKSGEIENVSFGEEACVMAIPQSNMEVLMN